jgi:hypothetical protein
MDKEQIDIVFPSFVPVKIGHEDPYSKYTELYGGGNSRRPDSRV